MAPGRQLETIYITHGHPDHWFGLPIILKQFPNATVLATEGTIKHARESVSEPEYSTQWVPWIGEENIPKPFVFPTPLPAGNKFLIGGKWECEAVEVGWTDTHDTTVLWIPELRLVVAGDVVYGQVHPMLMFNNTTETRAEWIRALDTVEKLQPLYVVAGHQQAGEIHGPWTIAAHREYIKNFEKVLGRVSGRGGSAEEAYDEMMALYGDWFNPMVMKGGFYSAFAALGK